MGYRCNRIALGCALMIGATGMLGCSGAKGSGLPAMTSEAKQEAIADSLRSGPGPTFQVPADQIPKKWTLIAYGDTRFTDPADHNATNPEARRALVAQIAAERPDALLISGDLPYNGSNANDYAVYKAETAVWREQHLRLYPALGNHELRGEEAKHPDNWWAAFPELKDRRWYSVSFGNAYILCVDSDLPLTAGSRQQAWIADQLDHLPAGVEFVFINLHHPLVADPILNDSSHNVRPNEKALADLLRARASRLHARVIVAAGHIHNYERFFEDGIVYLVSGGGGAKPYPIARTAADLYQDPSFPNYHYVRFQFDGQKLNATMFRLADPAAAKPSWQVKDHFIVTAPDDRATSDKAH